MTATSRLPLPPRWQRNAVFGALGATILLGWVGEALWAGLVDTHPLLLLGLNAKPRFVLLTVNDLDAWSYYPVAFLRLMATKPLVWLIGAWYGHRAVAWAERRSRRGAGVIRWVERHFHRWGWAVTAIVSNNVVCLLAGSTGFPLVWFVLIAALSTLLRLWLMAVVGDALSAPIDGVIELVVDHRPAVILLSVAVVGGGLWWQHRAGRSDLDTLASLEQAVTDDPSGEGNLGS